MSKTDDKSKRRAKAPSKSKSKSKGVLLRQPLWLVVAVALVLAVGLIGVSWWASRPGPGKPVPRENVLAGEFPALGDPAAPVVIEEYSDFQCPYCGLFARNTFPQLEREFIELGLVKFEFRYFVLLGKESQWATEAAACAHEQGRFWEYHDYLFQNQRGENRGAFTKANLKRFAQELGLDTEAFDACLDEGRYAEQVRQSTREGRARGVEGTPTFFINGEKLVGNQPYATFASRIRAALARAE